ncbi:MAG: DUF3524 domain-containing protein [Phycisphaerales bacterium]|nr:MAG: DUF3524 domain-containing protein [Phycisphaerales bacterium]
MSDRSPGSKRLRILAIEPYYGGSHQAFLDGWKRASGHEFRVLTMPARKWKWRMRGAAMWCAERLAEAEFGGDFDLIFTSDMMPVADLRALLPVRLRHLPLVCYFHENQLTYPLSPDDRRDYQYGFTNITSCLAANEVWFNSGYHRNDFLTATNKLLMEMPDCLPTGIARRIEARSRVLHPGVDLSELKGRMSHAAGEPPVIVWNHRWEYDKGPETFFRALFSLSEAGMGFRLRVAGERFRTEPAIFDEARRRLTEHVDHFGYYETREAYLEALESADLVVSTAVHEFFGLAVVEAIAAGCFPILPDRLSYPELIPPEWHSQVLYRDDSLLARRLAAALERQPGEEARRELATHARRCDWRQRAEAFDDAAREAALNAADQGHVRNG